MKNSKKIFFPSLSLIGFSIILIGVFFFLGLGGEFFLGPKGIHFMRQTDSLSFASQYFNNGFDFLHPKLYNLKNIDGRAACEFPITYYLTSLLYLVFGKSPAILKLVHLFILYAGMYSVFKLAYLFLKNSAVSILISLFFFTSTVFNYYSFNYLPDSAALGLNLLGLYYIFKYLDQNQRSALTSSFLFFTLGGLIKITYAISPLSVLVFALLALLFKSKNQTSNIQSKQILLFGGISIALIAAWNFYMLYYNSIYESHSFNTAPLPIWNMTKEEIIGVWDIMVNYWNSEYFAHTSMAMIVLLILAQIICIKKADHKLSAITLISFLGCLCYFVLFYSQFKDHDYYMLVFFPLLALLLINGMKVLLNFSYLPQLKIRKLAPLLLLVIVVYGLNYSRLQLNRRFNSPSEDLTMTSDLIEKNLFDIHKLNISSDSKFIIAPDPNQNGGLYLLDKEGWNIENIQDVQFEKITALKNKGARFLLLNDQKQLVNHQQFGKTIFHRDGLRIIEL